MPLPRNPFFYFKAPEEFSGGFIKLRSYRKSYRGLLFHARVQGSIHNEPTFALHTLWVKMLAIISDHKYNRS